MLVIGVALVGFLKSLDDKVGTAAWHTKPAWYPVANQDRMIDSHAEEAMAKEIGATTVMAPGRGSRRPLRVYHPQHE